MINDAHVHISVEPTSCFSDYTMQKYLNDKPEEVKNSIVFLNPLSTKLFPCPPDHFYKVVDCEDGLGFVCDKCSNVSHRGKDPYRELNEKVLDVCKNTTNIYPYLYLTLSNNTINDEFDYFLAKHKGKFFGIKVHPNICRRKMSEIKFNSAYPIIIHSGVGEFDNPNDIIKFAKNYSGNVLIAHFARFDLEALKKIAKLKNVFIDMSPTYLPYQIVNGLTDKYSKSELTGVKTISELIKNVISIIGEDKLVFGSDVPWGKNEEILELYKSILLDEKIKRNIFRNNFAIFNTIINCQ